MYNKRAQPIRDSQRNEAQMETRRMRRNNAGEECLWLEVGVMVLKVQSLDQYHLRTC